MKYISLLATLIVLFYAGTPAQARHKKQKKEKASAYQPVSVQIAYGPCFGRCPMYMIELDQNGLVTFTGIRNTEDSGSFTRQIEPAEALRILKLVETYRMDTCQDRYRVRIPDIQTYGYRIVYPKKDEKSIQNASFGPVYLKELAAELDQIGQKKKFGDWKRAVSQGKK